MSGPLATILYYLCLLFYAVPISLVSSLLILEDLEQMLPPVKTILCFLGSFVRSQIAAFLPGLTLILFLSKLPKICMVFSRAHGHPDLAVLEVEQIKNVWLFQFVWVLFGISVVSGLMSGADLVQLAQAFANKVIFFSIFLNIQVV